MAYSIGEKWTAYSPTKTVWFWSCIACIAATMLLGFTWGGWVTGGTADERVATATEDARAQLAADICAYQFLRSDNARAELAKLKEEDSWNRDTLVEDGGWVTFASMKEPVEGAAEMCAEALAEAELPAVAATDAAVTPETGAVAGDATVAN